MPIKTDVYRALIWLEHLTVNQRVLGSSPRVGAQILDFQVLTTAFSSFLLQAVFLFPKLVPNNSPQLQKPLILIPYLR